MNVGKTKQLSAVQHEVLRRGVAPQPAAHHEPGRRDRFLSDDELLEVTPQSLRIRKRILNNEERQKDQKRRERMLEGAG